VARRKRTIDLEIIRTKPARGTRDKVRVGINGKSAQASETQAAILACIFTHLGRVVSYRRLGLILGYKTMGIKERHVLRQYMAWVKRTLTTHKASYVLTVANHLGYAMCEISDD
jgi:DNA-binding response OmpR family regulator